MKDTLIKAAILLTFGIGVFLSPKALAQTERGRLEDAEIVVEKDRQIELPEATRNFQKIQVDPPSIGNRQVDFSFNDHQLPNQDIRLAMKVLTIRQEELPPLNGNYLKAGFGNYLTGYLKGHFHSTRNKDYAYGVDASHITSGRGPVGIPGVNYSGVSNSTLGLKGEMFLDQVTVGARLNYGRDRHNFYGFALEPTTDFDTDTLRQVFNRFGGQVYFKSNDADAPLQFNAGLGFQHMRDALNARESNFQVNANTTYALDKYSSVQVNTDLSVLNYTDSLSQGRGFFKIQPTYYRDMDLLKIRVGATIAYTGDTVNNARKFNFYPTIHADFEPIENKVIIFAGLQGDLQRVTLNQLTQENPFLGPNLRIADTNKGLDLYAGVTGNITKELQLTGRVAYQSYRNLYFFNNSPLDSSRFELVYDEGTTNVINVQGEVVFNASETVRVGLKSEYNSYRLAYLDQPYHRPSLQSTAFATVNLGDKIFLNSELYYISSTFGRIYRPQTDTSVLRETSNIMDLNIKGDYRFSPNFSAFLMGNNLFGQKYQRYLNYPTKGINLIAGITYSF